jgi:hypothetical protein
MKSMVYRYGPDKVYSIQDGRMKIIYDKIYAKNGHFYAKMAYFWLKIM